MSKHNKKLCCVAFFTRELERSRTMKPIQVLRMLTTKRMKTSQLWSRQRGISKMCKEWKLVKWEENALCMFLPQCEQHAQLNTQCHLKEENKRPWRRPLAHPTLYPKTLQDRLTLPRNHLSLPRNDGSKEEPTNPPAEFAVPESEHLQSLAHRLTDDISTRLNPQVQERWEDRKVLLSQMNQSRCASTLRAKCSSLLQKRPSFCWWTPPTSSKVLPVHDETQGSHRTHCIDGACARRRG